MRMSDTADTETMKVSEATDPASSPIDNATKSEVSEQQSQSSREEHGSNSKRDTQVKTPPVHPRNCPVRPSLAGIVLTK